MDNGAKDFRAIGQILRKKREEHSYTIEHVAEITRITLSNLRNIESGNIEKLPGKVFVKGFIRNYANLLGLDSDWMIETINQAYRNQEPQEGTEEQAETPQQLAEQPQAQPTTPVNLKVWGTAGGAVLAMALIVFLIFGGSSDPIEESNEVIQAVAVEESTTNQVVEQQAVQPQSISPLTLVLKAKASDWIYLNIDGKQAHQLKLEKHRRYEWPATEGYELTMATGAVAKLYLNGEEIQVSKEQEEQLFEMKLNKMTLTSQNN